MVLDASVAVEVIRSALAGRGPVGIRWTPAWLPGLGLGSHRRGLAPVREWLGGGRFGSDPEAVRAQLPLAYPPQ